MKTITRLPFFDARAAGAKCDECPLKDSHPVGPQSNSNASLIILAESPGKSEEIEGLPLIGASGYLLNRTLASLHIKRSECHVTNALLCRPAPGTYVKSAGTTAILNKALECCAPRLERELAGVKATHLLAMGDWAVRAVTDKQSAWTWRGTPIRGKYGHVVMPTMHPARVLREQALDPIFRTDVSRATGVPAWVWPKMVIDVGPDMERALRAILDAKKPIGVDVETRGIDPMHDLLMCIGVGNGEIAVSVPWEDYDAGPFGPSQGAPESIKALVREILASDIPKTMQNGQHDALSFKSKGIVCNNFDFDTLFAHAVVASQLDHNLEFLASCFWPMPKWKTEFHADTDAKGLDVFAKRDPRELRLYNAKDSHMTALLRVALAQRIERTHNGTALFREYMKLGDLAMRMRERGILVDMAALTTHRESLSKALEKETAKFYEVMPTNHVLRGKELKSRTKVYIGPYRLGKNGQHEDLKRLFFGKLGIKPTVYTEGGEPSLDDDTLQRIIVEGGHANLARPLSAYRGYGKLLSTYVDGLPIGPDGLVHCTWKVYGTVTGRWSSQDPNTQNIPPKMRNMLIARPGNYLVAADYSQLELRILAALSGDSLLLKWYEEGRNVHLQNARSAFGREDITKEDKEYKLAKVLVYLINYGGGADKLYKTLLPKFPGLTYGLVLSIIRAWFRDHPAVKVWQDEQVRFARENGYIEDTLSGRREYFHLGQVEPSKCVNFPIQTAAGSIMNKAAIALDKTLDWSKEGLILQVHDELVCEGPDVLSLSNKLRSAMETEVEIAGRRVKFPVEIEYGKDWLNQESAK